MFNDSIVLLSSLMIRFLLLLLTFLFTLKIAEESLIGIQLSDTLISIGIFVIICACLYWEKAYEWLLVILIFVITLGILKLIEVLSWEVIIAIMLVITIVPLIYFYRKKNTKSTICTLDDFFPDIGADIPEKELEQMKKQIVSYLRSYGVNDNCEINQVLNHDNTVVFHSDPTFNGVFHWGIMDSLNQYKSVSENPNLEEFTTLYIKSYYDVIVGII